MVPRLLFGVYLVECAALAVAPFDRTTWWAENVTMWCVVVPLVLLYWRGIRFSDTAYLLMAVLVFLHTVGGHYTFERVPFGWVTELLGASRNHFDRLAHFTVGFYAYAVMELAEARGWVRSRAYNAVSAVLVIFGVAALFELVEWCYAASADPAAGAAFLGSQGDVWDAQKDMLADGLGAVCAVGFYCARFRGRGRP